MLIATNKPGVFLRIEYVGLSLLALGYHNDSGGTVGESHVVNADDLSVAIKALVSGVKAEPVATQPLAEDPSGGVNVWKRSK